MRSRGGRLSSACLLPGRRAFEFLSSLFHAADYDGKCSLWLQLSQNCVYKDLRSQSKCFWSCVVLNGQLLSALPWSFPSPQHGVWGFWKFLHHVPYVLELSPRYRKCPGLCYLFILWQGSWLPRQHLLLQSTQFQIWPVLVSSGDWDSVLISC